MQPLATAAAVSMVAKYKKKMFSQASEKAVMMTRQRFQLCAEFLQNLELYFNFLIVKCLVCYAS